MGDFIGFPTDTVNTHAWSMASTYNWWWGGSVIIVFVPILSIFTDIRLDYQYHSFCFSISDQSHIGIDDHLHFCSRTLAIPHWLLHFIYSINVKLYYFCFTIKHIQYTVWSFNQKPMVLVEQRLMLSCLSVALRGLYTV